MRKLIRKHKQKFIIGNSIVIVLLLSTTLMLDTEQLTFFLSSPSPTIEVGNETTMDVSVNALEPVNAVSATMTFPADMIEVIKADKEGSSLDLWTQDPDVLTPGELTFGGGTYRKEGVMGPSHIIKLTVRGKKAGTAELGFKDTLAISNDGKGTIVRSGSQPFSIAIVEKAPAGGSGGGAASAADFNNDQKTTITDISIFLAGMISAYNPLLDMNMDGSVGLTDLSILLSYF